MLFRRMDYKAFQLKDLIEYGCPVCHSRDDKWTSPILLVNLSILYGCNKCGTHFFAVADGGERSDIGVRKRNGGVAFPAVQKYPETLYWFFLHCFTKTLRQR